jgi:tRNA A37 threonylcarbamoyladenosine modification protein TsaB
MGLVLAIEASSRAYAVAAGAGRTPSAQRASRREDPEFAGIGDLVARTLAADDAAFRDISLIAVDVGPGGLSSIRSAVAYANGLAFSLGVKIFSANSLELMAIAARKVHQGPLLIVKRGQGGNVYVGLFSDGDSAQLRYGPASTIIPALASGLPAVHVAGVPADDVVGLLPGVTVTDTGIANAEVSTLYQTALAAMATPERLVSVATAINEASLVFHEAGANHI